MRAAQEHVDQSSAMDERSWWDLWNTSYRSEDGRDPTSTQLFTHIADAVNRLSHGQHAHILEVACGAGTLSRRLAFASYRGIDMSPAAIAIAQAKAVERLPGQVSSPTYEIADFHSWAAPSEVFNVLICVDALHSFRDPYFVMRKMASQLSSGGHLVVALINPVVYNRIWRVNGVKLENGPVSHWHTKKELHQIIKAAQLTIEKSYTIMPRGNKGFLRFVNSARLNDALGSQGAAAFRRLKERFGLGQYRVVTATKG